MMLRTRHSCTAVVVRSGVGLSIRVEQTKKASVDQIDLPHSDTVTHTPTVLLAPDELRPEEDLGRAETLGADLQCVCMCRQGKRMQSEKGVR